MNTATIVQKLWNYCNVLRDDGMSYGDYVEQLALTPALSQRERGKLGQMADERSRAPCNQASPVLASHDWQRLSPSLALHPQGVRRWVPRCFAATLPQPRKRERGFSWGDELFDHYRHTLGELGKQKGLLGLIFQQVAEQVPGPGQAAAADRGLVFSRIPLMSALEFLNKRLSYHIRKRKIDKNPYESIESNHHG
jgi:hypothetical protein